MDRRTLVACLGGAPVMVAVPCVSQAQTTNDRIAVQAWLDNCVTAWAAGDADKMFRMATDDLEWINIVGMHWRGKAAVVAAHRIYLNTMFRGVSLTFREIESLRSVGPNVVLAVVRWSVGQFSPPDGSTVPAADDRMSLVFRKTSKGMMLVHGANVQINAAAAASDPSKGGPPPGRLG